MLRRHTVCCGRSIWINSTIDCADNCWTLQHCTKFLFEYKFHVHSSFLSFSFLCHTPFFLCFLFLLRLANVRMHVKCCKRRLLCVTHNNKSQCVRAIRYIVFDVLSDAVAQFCRVVNRWTHNIYFFFFHLILVCTLPVQSVGNCEIHTFFFLLPKFFLFLFLFCVSSFSRQNKRIAKHLSRFCYCIQVKMSRLSSAGIRRKDVESLKRFTLPNYVRIF